MCTIIYEYTKSSEHAPATIVFSTCSGFCVVVTVVVVLLLLLLCDAVEEGT